MKTYLYYCLTIVMLAWQASAENLKTDEWGLATCDVQMSISLKGDKKEIKVGEAFALLIRFRNISTNETFRMYQMNGTIYDPSYSFVIISPSGKDISPDTKKIVPGDSGRLITVPPNQIIEIEFDLSRLCKLDEVGIYRIVAKRRPSWSSADKQCEVVSNPINVSVVPGERKPETTNTVPAIFR